MTNSVTHSTYLAISPLMDREANDSGGKQRSLRRRREAILEFDPLSKSPKFGPGRRSVEMRDVLLLDSVGRMRQPMGERPVVRQQEESLGVHVESANREHTWFQRNKTDHGGPTLRIIGSRHNTSRLVE